MINIPISQSIRFRPVNSDLFNFDNTFNCNRGYIQYVAEDDLQIQIVITDDGESLSFLDLIHDGTRTRITDSSISTIGSYNYETYTIDFGTYPNQVCYLEAFLQVPPAAEVLSFRSEPVTVTDQPTFYKLNWFNSENNYLLDYSAGLVNECWIEGRMKRIPATVEKSIYSNQGEDTTLKSITKRMFQFDCDVPEYLAEQLTLAMGHDRFYINDVEYVVTKPPTDPILGTSNICQFTCELQQKTIIGLNTHDVG